MANCQLLIILKNLILNKQRPYQKIMSPIYTVFDTETTGLNPEKGDRIIEIAAIQIIDQKISNETFVTLFNPERPLAPEAAKVNGITPEMVEDAPHIKDILPYFLEFVGTSTLVAHNAEFDMKFLRAEMKNCGLKNRLPPVLCTLEMSRQHFSFQRHHNLDAVTKRFNIKISNRHRALGDVIATAQVFLEFQKMNNSSSD